MTDVEQPTIARLLSEQNSRTLPIACRFVPLDQWLITHIDTSWKIKDIKHWILSKCNAWGTSSVPQPPRFRPASPVTFAVPSRRSSMDSGSFGGTDDGEDDDWDAFAYDYNRDVRASDPGASASLDRSPLTRTTTHDLPAMPASTSSLNMPSGTSVNEAALLSKYSLVSFSCGYILEDEGSLSWYNLRPFELLELHRVGSIVPLPRGLDSYIDPYFESAVQVSERPYPRRSKRTQKQTRSMEEQQHTVEWKSKWAIIREGVLNICKDANSSPTHRFPLNAVMEIRGPEDLNIVSKGSSRVLCIKFKRETPSQREPEQGPWHPQDRRKPKSSKTSTWVLLDFPTRTTYENVIRVIHRLAPYPIHTSFVPSVTSPKTPTPSPIAPASPTSSSQHFSFASGVTSPSQFSHFGVQYPEWRLAVFARARKAGLGDVGPAMAHYIFGGATETEHYYHDLPRARSISEGIRRHAADGEQFSSTSSVPWMEEVEDGLDEDDVESEVEWDGWNRDLQRRGERPPLARTTTVTPAANGKGRTRPGAVSPSSPSSSSDYEGTGMIRARAMSFMPDSRSPMSPELTPSGRSGGRSRSSTISAATIGASSPFTSTTTTTITTYIDRVPDIPSQHRPGSNRGDALGLSLSPPPSSPERNTDARSKQGDGALRNVRRIVRGVSIRNAFSTERFAKNFDDALDFVEGK